jgi:hypothetical protein
MPLQWRQYCEPVAVPSVTPKPANNIAQKIIGAIGLMRHGVTFQADIMRE